MFQQLSNKLNARKFTVLRDGCDIRIYCNKVSAAVIVLNTHHGDITYTIYFRRFLNDEERDWLFKIMDELHDEYHQLTKQRGEE